MLCDRAGRPMNPDDYGCALSLRAGMFALGSAPSGAVARHERDRTSRVDQIWLD